MNEFNGIGRLTKDVELRETSSGQTVGSFTLAINGYKDHTDFIRCKIWNRGSNQMANNLEQYTHKGSQVGVTGEVRTGSYKDRDGKTIYTTEINVNHFDLLDPKQDKPDPYNQQNTDDAGMDIDESDLPFQAVTEWI